MAAGSRNVIRVVWGILFLAIKYETLIEATSDFEEAVTAVFIKFSCFRVSG